MATARPPVPPARPVAARPPASAVAPGATVPTPPVAATVVAATVIPAATVAPTGAEVPTVPVKAKPGRKPGSTVAKKDLAGYHGTFVYDAEGNAACDVIDGVVTPRRQQLGTMPVIGTAEGNFDPEKNEALKVRDFKKSGDFFRHRAELMTRKADGYLAEAKLADEGKSSRAGTTSKLVKVQSQMANLLGNLQKSLPPADFLQMLRDNGVDPAEFGLSA